MNHAISIKHMLTRSLAVCAVLTVAACSSGETEKKAVPAATPPTAGNKSENSSTQAATAAADKARLAAAEAAEKAKQAVAEAAEKAKQVAAEAEARAKQAAADAEAAVARAASQAKQQAAMKAQAMKQNAVASQQLSEGLAAATATAAADANAEKSAAPAAAIAATGDAGKGEIVARKCAGCHYFEAKAKVGPGLKGVYGRVAGSMQGFSYKFAEFIEPGKAWRWDDSHLAAWVCNSGDAVKNFTGNASAKTKMANQKVCDPNRQADLIAYLKTL